MVQIVEYPDRGAQAAKLADLVAAALNEKISETGRASFAAPGGSTPAAFLRELGARTVDWDRLVVVPTDERWAPPDSPRSNARMIAETLGEVGLISLWRAEMGPEEAAPLLSAAVDPRLPLVICVLGMGADMHCASLFPGAPTLAAALADDAPSVLAVSAPGAPELRVTLSARALASGSLHLLITGDDKRAALEAALVSDPMEAPVAAVLGRAKDPVVHWAP